MNNEKARDGKLDIWNDFLDTNWKYIYLILLIPIVCVKATDYFCHYKINARLFSSVELFLYALVNTIIFIIFYKCQPENYSMERTNSYDVPCSKLRDVVYSFDLLFDSDRYVDEYIDEYMDSCIERAQIIEKAYASKKNGLFSNFAKSIKEDYLIRIPYFIFVGELFVLLGCVVGAVIFLFTQGTGKTEIVGTCIEKFLFSFVNAPNIIGTLAGIILGYIFCSSIGVKIENKKPYVGDDAEFFFLNNEKNVTVENYQELTRKYTRAAHMLYYETMSHRRFINWFTVIWIAYFIMHVLILVSV